jgi:glycosyltransferase involved in cell wall biosynthesis
MLTNVLAPYRMALYRGIAESFDVTVMISGEEGNRGYWEGATAMPPGISVHRTRCISLVYRNGRGRVYNPRYLHLPWGHFFDLLRLRPDAVASSEMGLRSLIALTYGTLLGRPVWIGWGGTLRTERRIGRARRWLRRCISRWAKHWISYGETSTEYLEALGVPRERILQTQNCVEESLYLAPTPPALALHPAPVLLYVGQMILRKGVDQLLRAAAAVQQEGRDFSLLLVGDGPERANFQALSARLGLRHVTFLPARPPAELPAVYRSADVLVFPTLEDVWGLVVNEALWCGVPVIASRYAGAARELLPERQIFDPCDPDDFARALRHALDGELPPPDTSVLLPSAEVADLIRTEILRTLAEARP